MRKILGFVLLVVFAGELYAQPRHISTFGGSAAAPIRQAASQSANEIAFDVDLGMAFVKLLKPAAGLPQFSTVEWTSRNLPSGASIMPVARPGMPEIPYLVLTVAIPAGAEHFEPFMSGEKTSSLTNINLAPRPYQVNDTSLELRYDAGIYRLKERHQLSLSAPVRFRSLRMLGLRIPLVEFDPKTAEAKVKTKFHCGIRFTKSESPLAAAKSEPDPYLSSLYRGVVANTSDIERYAAPMRARKPLQQTQGFGGKRTFDTTVTGWIDTSAPYIKLTVTRTGLYRITAAELFASGIDASQWEAKDVRLFNKGKEIPVWVDEANGKVAAIEFFGERLAGFTNEYYNWTTDSNAYWLTNSPNYSGMPKRFEPRIIESEPPITITEGNITLHHERDYSYYGGDQSGGDDTKTVQRTDWIAGERFIWRRMKDPYIQNGNVIFTTLTDTFSIARFPQDITGMTARFRLFVRGISNTTTWDDTGNDTGRHICLIKLNGKEIDTLEFKQYDSITHMFETPLANFREGANIAEIISLKGAAIDEWYLDFYEIEAAVPLAASTDTSIATGQWDFRTDSAGVASVSLLSSAEPAAYNLTDGVRLTSVTSSGDAFNFRDSLFGAKRYAAATQSSYLKPARISSWNSANSLRWSAILDTSRGADYIIITHPEFIEASNKLAAQRDSAGLRAKVVTTDEVYNAFNFGSDEPWAFRRFLQYAYDYYQGTPPAFVTLMGDGTWDPKFNLNNTFEAEENRTTHRSFIHSYGVPSSDAIYTTVEGEGMPDSLTNEMVIARIPVETKKEAADFLQKLAEYESRPPEEWNRQMLFAIGGKSILENAGFWGYLYQYFDLDDWGGIRNSPMGINTTVISRTDYTDGIDKTHVADLQSEFRKGKSLVYFFGHGATFITDVFFSDPGLYRNKGLYPVYITLSCRTGAFAEPNQITLNEAFLRTPDGGVIMAYGTTGFGEVYYDRRLTANTFNFLRNDTLPVRMPATGAHRSNMASVFTVAKFISSVIEPVLGFEYSWYNALHQNTVLGDAAMGFALRPQPEFNLRADEVQLADKRGEARTVFSVTDSFVYVKAKVHNVGRVAESEVHVSFTNVQPKKEFVVIDTLARLDSSETITITIPLDTFAIGTNQLRVKIDNDEFYAETEERDNEAILTFQVSGFTATPFFPPEGAKNFCDVAGDSIRFVLMLPKPSAISGVSTVELEADTMSAFAAPMRLGSFNASGGFFEHSVAKTSLPSPASGVIWWRSRLTITGSDPSPWSIASVNIASSGTPMFSYTTGDQLERTIISGLRREPDGALAIPQSDTVIWDVIAHGQEDTNTTRIPISQILANRRSLFQFDKIGIIVAPIAADEANLGDTVYRFINILKDSLEYGEQLVKEFDSVIALIPDGRKVIVLTNDYGDIYNFTHRQEVTDALRKLGSRAGFDGVEGHASYALIGRKGAVPGTAKEQLRPSRSAGVELLDTSIVTGTSGACRTPFVFVANSYGKLLWQAENLAKDSSLIFRILGEPRAGGKPIVLKNILAKNFASADLSDIDARQFPRLAIEARFLRSSDVTESPRLRAIEYEYDPAPEFVIEENALSVDPNEVEEGQKPVTLHTIRNLLCTEPRGQVPAALVRSYQSTTDTLTKTNFIGFPGRSREVLIDSIPTLGYQGKVTLTAIVNPNGEINEQLLFNNSASAFFEVRRDSSKPRIDALFDRQRIQDGDYVSSRAEIAIQLFDDSPVRVKDSSSLIGILRLPKAQPVTFDAKNLNPNYNIRLNLPSTGSLQAELLVTPKTPFIPGDYLIEVFGFDGSGNPSDTLYIEFKVDAKQGVEHVMNYPNPFTDVTAFTFVLRSAPGDATNVNVYIYTTAGRRIRTLTLPAEKLKPGVNGVEWDGRDEDGNDVANGTYLYKVIVNGKNEDGSDMSDAVFEKAVRSR